MPFKFNPFTGTLDLVGATPVAYTDEEAQDAVGSILQDSSTVNFTYNDSDPSITAVVIQAGLDHGSIGGLADDDHTQYLTEARARDALIFDVRKMISLRI